MKSDKSNEMNDSVIPSMDVKDLAEPTPAVTAQRKVVEMAHAAFSAIGALTIKAVEAEKAAELLRYLDNAYAAECKKLDGIIASEMLGKPIEVNGSVLSLVEASH